MQSYGSRCVRPPIIYGDVFRPEPMTVRWATFAQSLTQRPVKGMLTGPVTILNWSFVRDDQSRAVTCTEIALAIQDEVRDLEATGIGVIQIDEPALREGLPLRQSEWAEYLGWATRAFRIASAVAAPETQIHTHMCYSEFGDIIDAIEALDADVLSIEHSPLRSGVARDLPLAWLRQGHRSWRLRHPQPGRPQRACHRAAAARHRRRAAPRADLGQPGLRVEGHVATTRSGRRWSTWSAPPERCGQPFRPAYDRPMDERTPYRDR